MGKVDPNAHGKGRPKLVPDDLEGTDAILTIAQYEELEVDDSESESGKRLAGFLTFVETGDHVLWLNKTAITALCEYYGDESDDWKGKDCPVEEHKGEMRGKAYHKVRVPAVDLWESDFNLKKPGSRKAAAPRRKVAKKKKTAKRRG